MADEDAEVGCKCGYDDGCGACACGWCDCEEACVGEDTGGGCGWGSCGMDDGGWDKAKADTEDEARCEYGIRRLR